MDERRSVAGWAVILAAVPGVVWGTVRGLGVGDAGASGIVEESLGGAGAALVLALFFIGVPALVVGTLDGLTVRIARTGARVVVRVLLLAGLGFWAGLWIYGFADIDCDGTCLAPDRAIVWTALAVTVVALVAEQAIAGLVGRRASRRAAEGARHEGGL